MKTLMMLAALVSTAAYADVQLYGTIRSGVAVSQTQIHGGSLTTRTSVDDLGSYIGLRGSHPIGNGSKMIWQFEQNAPAGGSGSMREYFKQKKDRSTIHAGG